MKKNITKKILSLVLGILMLSSVVLTSCQDDTEMIVVTTRKTRSVVMAVVSEEKVDEATEKLVEDAFNAITQAKYKTKVDLRYYTPDEYFNSILTLIENIKADELKAEEDKKNQNNKKDEETEAVTEEETLIDEDYGYAVYKYPEILENQLDILYIGGIDMYQYFVDQEYLAMLDENISTNSKLLKDFIFPEYLDAAKYNEITYAIPNNLVATDYTYLLINKELAEKYQYTEIVSKWTSIADTEAFVSDVAKFETGVVPVYGTLSATNVHNWSYDMNTLGTIKVEVEKEAETGEPTVTVEDLEINTFTPVYNRFSIFGTTLSSSSNADSILGCTKNIAPTTSFAQQLLAIQKFKENNYVSETLENDQTFAVGFVKGNEFDIAQYREDYEVIVLETPKVTANEIYGGMFGVYAESKVETDRCMEIITELNTDEELRNILQYGIEGTHYTIDEKTGILQRLNNNYMMDVNKTGNVFIAHAEEGVDPAVMEAAVQQTTEATIYPAYFFSSTTASHITTASSPYPIRPINPEYVTQERALSDKYWAKIEACKTVAELEAVLQEFNTDEEVTALLRTWNVRNSEDPTVSASPYGSYYGYLEDANIIVEE